MPASSEWPFKTTCKLAPCSKQQHNPSLLGGGQSIIENTRQQCSSAEALLSSPQYASHPAPDVSVIFNGNNALHDVCAAKIPRHRFVHAVPSTRLFQSAQSSDNLRNSAAFSQVPVQRTSLPRHSTVPGENSQMLIGFCTPLQPYRTETT